MFREVLKKLDDVVFKDFYDESKELVLSPQGKEIRKLHLAAQRTLIRMSQKCEKNKEANVKAKVASFMILGKRNTFACSRKFRRCLQAIEGFMELMEEFIDEGKNMYIQ